VPVLSRKPHSNVRLFAFRKVCVGLKLVLRPRDKSAPGLTVNRK